jgi:uncharacterized membrane protein (DUF2068 family)
MVTRRASRGDSFLLAIAVFKFVKGSALLAVTFGVAHLFHKDVQSEVESWLSILRIDPDNRYIGGLLAKLNLVHTKELKELTALGIFYSALFLTEGTGLLFRRRWAEWLTVVATASFLPLEIYELVHDLSISKVVLFLLNVAIVAFLIHRIRCK